MLGDLQLHDDAVVKNGRVLLGIDDQNLQTHL